MRPLLLGVLSCLGAAQGEAAAELHVSKVGQAPDFVGLRFAADADPLRLEAFPDHLMPATALPEARKARLLAEPSEAGEKPEDLGELALPAEGRHLLLLSRSGEGKVRPRLLPFDADSLPPGGVRFLNLTTRDVRCTVDEESVELAAGETKRLPTAVTARRIVNHRLALKTKDGWKTDSSTTLILGANRRFLFVLQEDGPRGALRRELVTDFDPARNLAALPAAPVRAEPPLPDPPAK